MAAKATGTPCMHLASTTPQASTETARARAWVMNLPEGSFFWSRDVPGRREVVSTMLSKLARGDDPPVERIGKGCYWRGAHWESGEPMRLPLDEAGIFYAGPGSGYADVSAVHALNWTTQVPPSRIATMRRLKPGQRALRYVRRPANERRRELTFAEVTVIEAVRHFSYSEIGWDRAVDRLGSGRSGISSLWPNPVIRAEALRWAAATEPGGFSSSTIRRWGSDSFTERINDLCDHIPDVMTSETKWRDRIRPAAPSSEREADKLNALIAALLAKAEATPLPENAENWEISLHTRDPGVNRPPARVEGELVGFEVFDLSDPGDPQVEFWVLLRDIAVSGPVTCHGAWFIEREPEPQDVAGAEINVALAPDAASCLVNNARPGDRVVLGLAGGVPWDSTWTSVEINHASQHELAGD